MIQSGFVSCKAHNKIEPRKYYLVKKKYTNDEIKHFISRKGVEIAHLVDHSDSSHNESNIMYIQRLHIFIKLFSEYLVKIVGFSNFYYKILVTFTKVCFL